MALPRKRGKPRQVLEPLLSSRSMGLVAREVMVLLVSIFVLATERLVSSWGGGDDDVSQEEHKKRYPN